MAVKALIVLSLACLCSGCLVVAAGAGAEGGYIAAQEDRNAGETVSDQWITSKVKSKLLADPDVSGLRINVDTKKTVVTLHGELPSKAEIEEAIKVAKSVKGVSRVVSKLKVAGD